MRGIARYRLTALFGLTAIIISGLAIPALAQDHSSPEWGILYSTEQYRDRLAEDPTAGASVVFDRGLITVGPGFKFTFERRRRIQIFRADAYRFANVEIPYHKSDKIETVEAHTLTKDGRRVEVTGDQFYKNEAGDWRTLVFAFPEVSPGCVIEYRYTLVSRNFYYLRPWVFQDEVPSEYSELAVRLPEGFEYTAVVNNSDYVLGPDTLEYTSMRHHDQKVRQFTWHARNLPPLVSEPLVTSMLDHRVILDFQIVRYRDGSHVWEFVDTWSDLAGQVKRAYDPLLRPGEKWPTWEAPRADVSGGHAERLLARRIYEFARDSVALGDKAYSVYDGDLRSARTVFRDRRGNAIEKNLLLVALLRHHGYSAWPVLISRRSHLRFDHRDHRLDQFDHVIVLVEINGERVYCESNIANAWLGYLPPDDQVDAGVVIGYPNSDEIVMELPAPPIDVRTMADGSIDLRPDGSAAGHLEIEVSGQAAYELVCALADHDTVGYLHSEWFPGIIPTAINIVRDKLDQWAPIRLTVDFEWPEAASSVDGDRLFIRPAQLHPFSGNPLLCAQRRYPISFDTPWSEDCRMIWRPPAGFSLSASPIPQHVSGDGFEFRSAVSVGDNGEIIAQRFWHVSRRDFAVRHFEKLREMFATVDLAQKGLLLLYREN